MIIQETRDSDVLISTDPTLLDISAIHAYLTRSYWAEGIPKETVAHSVAHSLCFGVYHTTVQIGLARIISDYATFAYLSDVYILEEWRGKGLSKRLMEAVKSHSDLQGLRIWLLGTRDAHGLYRQFGFESLPAPERYMLIRDPDVYKRSNSSTGNGG